MARLKHMATPLRGCWLTNHGPKGPWITPGASAAGSRAALLIACCAGPLRGVAGALGCPLGSGAPLLEFCATVSAPQRLRLGFGAAGSFAPAAF